MIKLDEINNLDELYNHLKDYIESSKDHTIFDVRHHSININKGSILNEIYIDFKLDTCFYPLSTHGMAVIDRNIVDVLQKPYTYENIGIVANGPAWKFVNTTRSRFEPLQRGDVRIFKPKHLNVRSDPQFAMSSNQSIYSIQKCFEAVKHQYYIVKIEPYSLILLGRLPLTITKILKLFFYPKRTNPVDINKYGIRISDSGHSGSSCLFRLCLSSRYNTKNTIKVFDNKSIKPKKPPLVDIYDSSIIGDLLFDLDEE